MWIFWNFKGRLFLSCLRWSNTFSHVKYIAAINHTFTSFGTTHQWEMYNCLREQSSAVHVCLRFWKGPEALTKSESFPDSTLHSVLAAHPSRSSSFLRSSLSYEEQKGTLELTIKLSNHWTEKCSWKFRENFCTAKRLPNFFSWPSEYWITCIWFPIGGRLEALNHSLYSFTVSATEPIVNLSSGIVAVCQYSQGET